MSAGFVHQCRPALTLPPRQEPCSLLCSSPLHFAESAHALHCSCSCRKLCRLIHYSFLWPLGTVALIQSCLGSVHRGTKMVGAGTKLSRTTRSSHRSRHYYFVEERLGGTRITPAGTTLGMPPLEVFEGIQHPSEPVDLDQPARCPPPEGNIMRDGEMWREMLARKMRHQTESKLWDEGDAVAVRTGKPPRRRVLHSPREKYLFTKHSAPERAVRTIAE